MFDLLVNKYFFRYVRGKRGHKESQLKKRVAKKDHARTSYESVDFLVPFPFPGSTHINLSVNML